MGKYALFIWAAYGVSAFVLSGLTLYIWSDLKRQGKLLQSFKDKGTPKRPSARAMDKEPQNKVSA